MDMTGKPVFVKEQVREKISLYFCIADFFIF